MAVNNEEVLKVLDAVVSYLSITLPCQPLSPDAEMGRESLLNKVQSLADRLTATDKSFVHETKKESPDLGEEMYDDVVGMELPAPVDSEKEEARQSCYMEMHQEDQQLQNVDASLGKPSEVVGNEAQNVTEVTELLEEDEEEYDDFVPAESEETYDDVANSNIADDTEFGLTDDVLLLKLKGLENTSVSNILQGSLFSGWLSKQKKKWLTKWHKRYCILRDEFLFYYQTDNDTKALGVIVLPGYKIEQEKSNGKEKLMFKLLPTGKGRSTYMFQAPYKNEYNAWISALEPICSQKLSRLSSEVFNRVTRKMGSAEIDESNGDDVKKQVESIQEEGDMYEYVPEEGLAATQNQDQSTELYDDHIDGKTDTMTQQVGAEQEDIYEIIEANMPPSPRPAQSSMPPPIPSPSLQHEQPNLPPRSTRFPVDVELYDDHVDSKDNMDQIPAAAGDLYEGIPGENYEPESKQAAPIQEDLYEDIGQFQQETPPAIPSSMIPPPLPGTPPPLNPAPPLPTRVPSVPDRRPVGQDEDIQPPSLPPPIPRRGEEEKTVLLEEDGPSESDFSYENVYIGTEAYSTNESDELAFSRGDLIYILQKVNTNWWVGCLDMKVGLVPSKLLIAGFAH